MFHYPDLLKVICSELISRHHKNLLTSYFGIMKTQKLIAKKYYWPMLQKDFKAYIKGCNICLASKAVCHKPYKYLQWLPVSIYWWKNLSMDFVTSLLISANWKSDSYDLIQVIVDKLTKIVYYKLIKATIDIFSLAKMIINIIIYY